MGYHGGMAHHLCRRNSRLPTHLATMNLLFNGWVGLLDDIDSSGKLTVTLDGARGYAVIGRQLGRCKVGIILIPTSCPAFSAIVRRFFRPVVDPSTKQTSGIRVKVAPQLRIARDAAKLVARLGRQLGL